MLYLMMNPTMLRHILSTKYVSRDRDNIYVSYKSRRIWVKHRGKWLEFTFEEAVFKFAPVNCLSEYLKMSKRHV